MTTKNPAGDLGDALFTIAMAALSIAVLALLIRRAGDTVMVTQAVGDWFTDLLNILTFGGGGGGGRAGRL